MKKKILIVLTLCLVLPLMAVISVKAYAAEGLSAGTCSVTMASWTYGDTPAEPLPVSATNGVGSVTYKYVGTGTTSYAQSAQKPTNAGRYKVIATFAATAQYNVCTAEGSFNIRKKELLIRPSSNQKKYYGEADPVIEYTYSGNLPGDTPQFTGVIERIQGENVGKYEFNPGNLTLRTDTVSANYTFTILGYEKFEICYPVFSVYPKLIPIGDNGWVISRQVITTAPDGYLISPSGSLTGNTWSERFTQILGSGAQKNIEIWMKKVETGAISPVTILAQIDDATPTGRIFAPFLGTWNSVLSQITFGLIVADDQTFIITGTDDVSGIGRI